MQADFIFHQMLDFLRYNRENLLVFQSVAFVVSFLILYGFYQLVHERIRIRNALLLIFSLFFYYKISGGYLLLLLLIAASDFFIGLLIRKSVFFSRFGVLISCVFNISFLIYYKYTYFFIDLFNQISESHFSLAYSIIPPIGISYFIFKSLSYVIDLDREVIEEPEKNFLNYLLFVSYFPNILAGPLSKARDLLPRFREKVNLSREMLYRGTYFIVIGLIKKVAIADFIAGNMTARVFESPEFFSSLDKAMAAIGGITQLFFDFAGYTDLVAGMSLLLGFEIEGNFNQPFKATNISGFWKRWHMSFYSWLSEYIYQPVAFSLRRHKLLGTLCAIYLTFLVSGIWHGASLTFIVWAILHGTAIALEVFTTPVRLLLLKKAGNLYLLLSTILTFLFLALTGLLLHCPDIFSAISFLTSMFTGFDVALLIPWLEIYYQPFLVLLLGLILQYLPISFYGSCLKFWQKIPVFFMSLIVCIVLLLLYQMSSLEAIPFKYIQF